MKRLLAFLAVLVMTFGICLAGVDVKRPNKSPKWNTPEWKVWVKVNNDTREAASKNDYAKVAESTPFDWVAAWAYYNLAGQTVSAKNSSGEWNFCNPDASQESKNKAKDILVKSETAMNDAIKAGVIGPKGGKNSMKSLEYLLTRAKEHLNGEGCVVEEE